MADGENTGPEPDEAELNARYALFKEFSTDVMELWVKYQQRHDMAKADPTKFSRITSHALVQLGATIAVDVHQQVGQFSRIAHACHKLAYSRAQKFG